LPTVRLRTRSPRAPGHALPDWPWPTSSSPRPRAAGGPSRPPTSSLSSALAPSFTTACSSEPLRGGGGVNSVRNDTETMACASAGPAFRARAPGPLLGQLPSGRLAPPQPGAERPIVAKARHRLPVPRCVTPGSWRAVLRGVHSFARRLGPAATCPAVMRISVTDSSSRNSSGAQGSKDDTREVIREADEGRAPRSHPQV